MQREQFFRHEARIQSHNSGSTVLRQKDNKMDEASATLSWEDVKEWMEKQQPYMLKTVLTTASNLLVPYCNNSEHSASEDADMFEDQEENDEADVEEFEARVREWNKKENGGEKTASNKVALEDVNETLVEEYISQERAIFGGDEKFHKGSRQKNTDIFRSG